MSVLLFTPQGTSYVPYKVTASVSVAAAEGVLASYHCCFPPSAYSDTVAKPTELEMTPTSSSNSAITETSPPSFATVRLELDAFRSHARDIQILHPRTLLPLPSRRLEGPPPQRKMFLIAIVPAERSSAAAATTTSSSSEQSTLRKRREKQSKSKGAAGLKVLYPLSTPEHQDGATTAAKSDDGDGDLPQQELLCSIIITVTSHLHSSNVHEDTAPYCLMLPLSTFPALAQVDLFVGRMLQVNYRPKIARGHSAWVEDEIIGKTAEKLRIKAYYETEEKEEEANLEPNASSSRPIVEAIHYRYVTFSSPAATATTLHDDAEECEKSTTTSNANDVLPILFQKVPKEPPVYLFGRWHISSKIQVATLCAVGVILSLLVRWALPILWRGFMALLFHTSSSSSSHGDGIGVGDVFVNSASSGGADLPGNRFSELGDDEFPEF